MPTTSNCSLCKRRTRHPSGYCQIHRRGLRQAVAALQTHRTEVIAAAGKIGLADPERAVNLITRALHNLAIGHPALTRPPEASE